MRSARSLFSGDGSRSLIIRNSAKSIATNYTFAADNRYGPIFDLSGQGTAAVNGSSSAGGSPLATTDPWANFSY